MELHGKRMLVVGGGNGIGAATVVQYAEEGASVTAFGVNVEAGERTIKEAANRGAEGRTFTYQQVDIRDQAATRDAVGAAVESMGGLDGVTVTAGMEAQLSAVEVDTEHLHDIFGVNVYGAMYAIGAALPHLVESGGGSIITYSSGAGMDGFGRMPTYSAAKAAILGYTRHLAIDWGPHHIRANAICPAVETPMMAQFMAEKSAEERQAMEETFAAKIPLGGKPGDPIDAANLNVFLSSDRGRFITGQTIPVDGGFNIAR